MNRGVKIGIVLVIVLAIGIVFYLKSGRHKQETKSERMTEPTLGKPNQNNNIKKPEALPRLVDLGAGKCIACKKMAPILEQLREEFKGKVDVEFIDVWENPDEGDKYGIRLIPTQIFYDTAGKEVFRHEGFLPREEILEQFKKMGIDVSTTQKGR
jgi:thioredoxin 1